MTRLAVCKNFELPDEFVGSPGDFAFLDGAWLLVCRRLKKRHVGSDDWDAFDVEMRAYSLLGGLVSADEAEFARFGFSGATFRHLDLTTKLWSIYWINSRDGVLTPPVQGGFNGNRGEFYGDDMDGDIPILCRFIWSKISAVEAHWEQAFSLDGREWETNWTMALARIA